MILDMKNKLSKCNGRIAELVGKKPKRSLDTYEEYFRKNVK